MANSPTTIELNGVKYDVRTGQIITGNTSLEPEQVKARPALKTSNAQVLDGFVRQPQSHSSKVATHHKAKSERKTNLNHAQRKLAKSTTLMRPALKKPTLKNDIEVSKKSAHIIGLGNSLSRQKRAFEAHKSPNISKFGGVSASLNIVKKQQHVEVIKPTHSSQNIVKQTSGFVNNELQQIENALLNANSHLQQLENSAIKKVPLLNRIGLKNRFANVSAMSLALVLLIGFFAYQNTAIISMKLASSKSGISANLPTYKPAGYSVKNIQSSPGSVNVAFKSNSNGNEFQLTQTASNWNSSTLLSDQVLKEQCASCYQTYQSDGKTIYIYDNANATWVNGGIIYKIGGNSQLSSDQIIKLANSL